VVRRSPLVSDDGIRSLWRDPEIRRVLSACVTLGFAIGVVGVTFGVSAIAAGATTMQASAMSVFVFTGASQLSSVSVFASGGSAVAAFGGAAVLAARNAVYGLAMAPTITGSLRTRLLAAHLTIDESTAMSATQHDPRHARLAFWITGASVFAFWNLGTIAGALIGHSVNLKAYGLDAAFPAGFIAMIWPLLRERRSRRAAMIGAAICLVLIPFTPVGVPILCASLGVLAGVPTDRSTHAQGVPG
jgi:4-azaleucine resistance transporter AzlC